MLSRAHLRQVVKSQHLHHGNGNGSELGSDAREHSLLHNTAAGFVDSLAASGWAVTDCKGS